jgi:hypothetical protein
MSNRTIEQQFRDLSFQEAYCKGILAGEYFSNFPKYSTENTLLLISKARLELELQLKKKEESAKEKPLPES